MLQLKLSVEIKTYLPASSPDTEAFLAQIESEWKQLLDCLGFELQSVDRYSQGVCDCDHAQRREWSFLTLSVKRSSNNALNCHYLVQIVQAFCGLTQSHEEVDYCNLSIQ